MDPGHVSPLGIVCLQEVARGMTGWKQEQYGKWFVLTHQPELEWRGTGVAVDTYSWTVTRRLWSSKGTWFKLKHLTHASEIWVGSVYLAPHLTTGEMQAGLEEQMRKLPGTTLPVFLAGDANAALKWSAQRPTCYGTESKSRALLDTLATRRFRVLPPVEAQLHQATSRPRKETATGRAIDWIACLHTEASEIQICTDSCFDIGTDHDLLISTLLLTPAQRQPRLQSGRRLVRSTPVLQSHLDQEVLQHLARTHTSVPKGASYKDDSHTKALFRMAKQSKCRQDWKRALRARKEGLQKWREDRVHRALGGDWQALRECRVATTQGWESALSEHLHPLDAHTALHQHYEAIFDQNREVTRRSLNPPRSPDITEEALMRALAKGKSNKSVGVDGVSLELLRAIVELEEGRTQMLTWYNHILHTGRLPDKWLDGLMILLPKVSSPKQVNQTRPIVMGCAAEKIYSRVILERSTCRAVLSENLSAVGLFVIGTKCENYLAVLRKFVLRKYLICARHTCLSVNIFVGLNLPSCPMSAL